MITKATYHLVAEAEGVRLCDEDAMPFPAIQAMLPYFTEQQVQLEDEHVCAECRAFFWMAQAWGVAH